MSETRKTFVIPNGYEAVCDERGRATGEVRMTRETLESAIASATSDCEKLREALERMRAALRATDCPRPCNGRPDDFTAGQCFDAGECGCGVDAALQGGNDEAE